MAIGGPPAGASRGRDTTRGAAGRYAFVLEVARGYLGTLWIAHDPADSSTAFVRHIAPIAMTNVRAAVLEAARWGQGAKLPSSSPTLELVEGKTSLDVVMPAPEGEILRTVLRTVALKHVPAEPGLLLGIARALLLELHALHHHAANTSSKHGFGGVHPDSVFIDTAGRVQLFDVGAAAATSAREPWHSDPQRMGYFAPEQLEVRGVPDARTDVFAVGVMLWEALTNRRLFPGNDAKTVRERLQRGPIARLDATRSSASPGISTPISNVIARALERDPAQRFSNAEEMANALGALECADARRVGEWLAAIADAAIAKRRQVVERVRAGGPLPGDSLPPPSGGLGARPSQAPAAPRVPSQPAPKSIAPRPATSTAAPKATPAPGVAATAATPGESRPSRTSVPPRPSAAPLPNQPPPRSVTPVPGQPPPRSLTPAPGQPPPRSMTPVPGQAAARPSTPPPPRSVTPVPGQAAARPSTPPPPAPPVPPAPRASVGPPRPGTPPPPAAAPSPAAPPVAPSPPVAASPEGIPKDGSAASAATATDAPRTEMDSVDRESLDASEDVASDVEDDYSEVSHAIPEPPPEVVAAQAAAEAEAAPAPIPAGADKPLEEAPVPEAAHETVEPPRSTKRPPELPASVHPPADALGGGQLSSPISVSPMQALTAPAKDRGRAFRIGAGALMFVVGIAIGGVIVAKRRAANYTGPKQVVSALPIVISAPVVETAPSASAQPVPAESAAPAAAQPEAPKAEPEAPKNEPEKPAEPARETPPTQAATESEQKGSTSGGSSETPSSKRRSSGSHNTPNAGYKPGGI